MSDLKSLPPACSRDAGEFSSIGTRLSFPKEGVAQNIFKKRMWDIVSERTADGFVFNTPAAKKQRSMGKTAFDKCIIEKLKKKWATSKDEKAKYKNMAGTQAATQVEQV